MITNQLCNDYNYIMSAKLYKIYFPASKKENIFQCNSKFAFYLHYDYLFSPFNAIYLEISYSRSIFVPHNRTQLV